MKKILNRNMRNLLGVCLFLVSLTSLSQDAKALLDKVGETADSYENIYIEFMHKLDNTAAQLHQQTSGKVTMQGDLYKFEYMGSERIFDGTKIYTILHEDEEVVITLPKQDDNSEILTPSNILSFYENGFTYEMDIVQNVENRKIQFVKLTPIDSEAELKYIHVGIDTATNHIYKVIQTGKEATITTITVSKMETNQSISDQLFTFDQNKFKEGGYYISEPK
jgi:outer membrane lipoprotein-sorting protein